MKRPDDHRLWIDRLGVRMDEPRQRYVINTDQVMTSSEYDGDLKDELYEYRLVLDVYFEYCKEVALNKQRALACPPVPDALRAYLTRGGSTDGEKKPATRSRKDQG